MAAATQGDNNETQIEPDRDLYDASDSSLGDEISKYTASLTSSIERYPIENGRRYHAYKDGSYVMPNDELELDRLDLMHQMIRICMDNQLHHAPIGKNPGKILDVGTGTGIWAIEMGDEYPNSEILGTDLSPVQPSWVPPNVKFEVDDAEETWAFPQKFDFVHVRYMAFSLHNFPKLVRQCYENTAPGGWVEFQDFMLDYYSEDGSYREGLAVHRWATTLLKACRGFGVDPSPGPELEKQFKEVGLQNVVAKRYRLPIGPWAKDKRLKTLGSWNLVQVEDGLEGFTLRLFTQALHWTPEETQVLLANVRKDLRDPKIHIQYDLYVVYGQKPKLEGA